MSQTSNKNLVKQIVNRNGTFGEGAFARIYECINLEGKCEWILEAPDEVRLVHRDPFITYHVKVWDVAWAPTQMWAILDDDTDRELALIRERSALGALTEYLGTPVFAVGTILRGDDNKIIAYTFEVGEATYAVVATGPGHEVGILATLMTVCTKVREMLWAKFDHASVLDYLGHHQSEPERWLQFWDAEERTLKRGELIDDFTRFGLD